MCDTCGCTALAGTEPSGYQPVAETGASVSVVRKLLQRNDDEAAHNRAHFDAHGMLAINLMSSPGAGKTALLEATIDALKGRVGIAVIEGDLETEHDAERIRARGVPALQITTGGACHLDARMVHDALHRLPLAAIDLLFIENVGNLVCPASFDLGQHRDVVLLSVTEGDDKPAKYPVMFRKADLVLLTKTDLLPHMDDFDPRAVRRYLDQLACNAPLLPLAPRKGAGMTAWLDWLHAELAVRRGARASLPATA